VNSEEKEETKDEYGVFHLWWCRGDDGDAGSGGVVVVMVMVVVMMMAIFFFVSFLRFCFPLYFQGFFPLDFERIFFFRQKLSGFFFFFNFQRIFFQRNFFSTNIFV